MHPQILIDYIKQNGLDALTKNLAVDIKRHGKYPNLVLLKYSQLDSPMANPIVQLCRGIILDEANDWKVVCLTFTKFFNALEGNAAQIEWDSSKVFEKLDGSLCQLYYYDGHWEVSTSGMPDAAGQVGDFGFSFADLFWRIWNESGYKLPTDTNFCFSFELCSKLNRVVVQHKKERIVLHGGRNLETFNELNPIVEAHHNGWECVRTFPLKSLEQINEFIKTINPMEGEGFVVCDSNYNRVKLKSPQYVALSHLKDSVGKSKRQLVEVVRNNESSEFLAHFPELTTDYYEVKVKYERLLGQIEGFYEAIKHLAGDKKKFAAQATTQKFSGALFAMNNGNIKSFKQFLAEMHIKHLEAWLGIKEEDEKV